MAGRCAAIWGLRHQPWTAGPDLCRAGSVPDDSAVEQESQTVVAEVPESVGSTPDLLDLEVDGLGGSVRRPAGIEIGQELPPPGAQRATQPGGLGDGAAGEAVENLAAPPATL